MSFLKVIKCSVLILLKSGGWVADGDTGADQVLCYRTGRLAGEHGNDLNPRFDHAVNWLKTASFKKFAAALGVKPGGWVGALLGWQKRPSIASLAVDLKASASGLKAVGGKLEQDFLATSTALEKLADHGERFLKVSEDLVGSATGRTGGSSLLYRAMQVVEEPLNFLDDSHPKTQVILQRLRQDSSRIDELINVQVELRQTVGPLKYIQTLFKIESAPLGGDVQAMFGALTKEIEILHDQICELFTTRFLELRAVQGTVNQVSSELQAQSEGLWQSVAREKAKIEKSMQQMQGELEANQNRESHISQLGRQVFEDIQRVVVGLQYQDIINQKMQHVLASLGRMEEHLESEQAVELGPACRLEAGQLEAVREELAAAEKSIKDGITTMLSRLVNASTGCLTLEEYSQLTISADGMVQILFDTFATLREQVTATVTSSAKALAELRAVGGLASDLTHVVREHSQRIHLIGLNAQLQAAQVKQAGLEVLSARTSEISRATNQISEAVAQKLDQLVKDLADDVKALEMLNAEALRQQGKLAAEGAATEHSLHEMRDGALNLLTQINALLEDIRTEAQETLEDVHHVETADAALSGLKGKLLELADTADAQSTNPEKSAALMAQAQQGYTMNSQREVFAQVAGQDQPVASPDESAFELFQDPAAEALFPAMPEREPAGETGGESLPLEMAPEQAQEPAAEPAPMDIPPAPPNPPTHPAKGNLGDNVEMF